MAYYNRRNRARHMEPVFKSHYGKPRVAGLSIPDDISIIGVDNFTQICEVNRPTLTSIEMTLEGGNPEIRFKAATGQTFLEAIRLTRLAHAEDLLSRKGEGKRNIIANECGYAAWSSVHRLMGQRKSEARNAYHRASEQRAAAQRILT